MGNVASMITGGSPKKRKKVPKKKKRSNVNAAAPPPAVPTKNQPAKFTVNSKACTYNASSNQWRCVHRRASTANNLNSNDWDGFWVNDMPYSYDPNENATPPPSKKPKKGPVK